MCGLVGYMDLHQERKAENHILARMMEKVVHRGPDSAGTFVENSCGLGFRRLAIVDLESGDQPLFNEDRSIVLVCNGEIYNYRELRHLLEGKGHSFRTNSDVEVLLHLYESYGTDFLNKLNGQFAFALYDRNERQLFLARDHFGINPLYYMVADDVFIFASEIKAILEHPLSRREVDPTGLDQILSFPGLVSPTTIFKGIASLKSGHSLRIKNGEITTAEYWDLDYPRNGEKSDGRPACFYIEGLQERLAQSVKYRLQADVPVGFYLSGGLDSSLIAALIARVSPGGDRQSFSISFTDKRFCESRYQRAVAQHVNSVHHEIPFDWSEISVRMPAMIYHCECPVKESYNTCSLALSEATRKAGIKVILTGEGADELFAGYVGYRFDQFTAPAAGEDVETFLEEELRERLWGDRTIFYEKNQYALREVKRALYSPVLNEQFDSFDCLNHQLANKERLKDRHPVHQRSYLDFKLRLSDHLISDHGDKMGLANSVEARYPFLDIDLINFAIRIPPDLKLSRFSEKHVLKKAAEGLVPQQIIEREKFGFHAPGSPALLRQNVAWADDMLSCERLTRQGYFNPAVVERLKQQYARDDFRLNLPFEDDLLMIVLTFGILLDQFNLPNLN